ncbi:MAG: Ig-like domain-containing protein [Chloroflexota bacterium]
MTTQNEIKARLGSTAYATIKDDLRAALSLFNFHNIDQLLAAWETPINGTTVEAKLAAESLCPTGTNWPNLCDANSTIFWLDSDSDDDGLSDKFEYDNQSALGTNFAKYDSDGDGLSDGFEFQIGTAINAKDTDGDGLTDDQEVYHPTADGSWAGGYTIELPKYGAVGPNGRVMMTVRVFSDPRSKDTDGDGMSDAAEKENGTSPTAYNRVPRVSLTGQPWAVSPTGQGAVYVGPGDRITLTSRIEVYPPFTVSDTLTLNVPNNVMGANTTPSLNGSRTVPNTGYFQQPQWNFSNNVLQPWEYLYASTPGWSPSVSSSRTATATLTLPYNGGSATQTAELPIVLDAEQPGFSLLTPAHGELIGGGVTHYVMGGSSNDRTTWVDHINLDLPFLGTQTISDSRHLSPWAYTWELPADGIYNIGGYAVDFVDNISTMDVARIMIDNTAPTVDVDLQDGAVYGPPQDSSVITITLRGSATENYSGLTRVQISTDNGPWREVWTKAAATVTNTTYTDFSTPFYTRATGATWTAEWTLPNVETVQGYHSLRVRAFDEAGNWPTVLERTIIVDVLPPTDELVNRAYISEFPHVPANEPHTFRGVANDVGNVPQPSRPVELVGTLDSINDATIWLGLSSIDENNGGINVAWIGDFNGDRRGDLLVGLPAADAGAGRVTVIYGRSGNWPVPDSAEMLDDASTSFIGLPGAGIGLQATPAGDVNGDGLADLIIGDAANNAVYLVLGNTSYYGDDLQLDGGIGVNIRRLQVPAGQQIGHNIAAAGDVNGDGYDDILIGVTGSRNAAYLLLGQPDPIWITDDIDQHAAAVIYTAGTATLGTAGDLNGDFRDEFVVGLSNTLYLFSGSGTYAPRTGLALYPTSNNVATFSSADANPTIAALGDVDGDNKDDAIYSNGGSQVLLFGDDTLTDGNWTTHTYSYGAGFLAAPGDVDGDGRSDILIGNGTNAYLILGNDIGSAQATINGVAAAASVRYAAGADLNSDGSSDLLLVPTATSSQAAETAETGFADLPPTWVPNLPEQSLDTFTGSNTWENIPAHVYVSGNGDCHGMNPCYSTIQAAVDSVFGNATILVQPGVYAPFVIDGNAKLHEYLTIKGMDTDAVIIDGNGSSYGVLIKDTRGIKLENMTIRNANYGVQLDGAGINGHEFPTVRIQLKYVLIYDTGSHDIYMSRDSTASVINSTLSRSSNHIGAYGAADPNIVVEWTSMANSQWPILPGGGAVTLGEYIYTLRGGGNSTFGRYDIAGNYWSPPWGPKNNYEDNSAIALGSDDQVYVIGAPHMKDARPLYISLAQVVPAADGNTYMTQDYAVHRWTGTAWQEVPGSPPMCELIATHPVNSNLYCLDYGGDSLDMWDGTSWTTLTEDKLPGGSLDHRDMAVDSEGVVHVVGNFSFNGCYHHAILSGNTWYCQNGFEADDNLRTIVMMGTTPIIGGSFSNDYYDNIAGPLPGVSGSVNDIEVGENGTIYVAGLFTSTLQYNGNLDQAAPAGIAAWKNGSWTVYPPVTPLAGEGTGYSHNYISAHSVAETAGGEIYAAGQWITYIDGFGNEKIEENVVRWNGSAWERVALGKNISNNGGVGDVVDSASGVFLDGGYEWLELPDGSTLDTWNVSLLEFSHEVYSTTQHSWVNSMLPGAPMSLGDGASYAGDDDGNLVLLVGGGRTDSFKYDIKTGQWFRVDGMPHPVNVSAMTKGENGDVYAITDSSGSFYHFNGFSWSPVGPTFSGATLADGATLTYDTHFGTYYLLPGGNSTQMFRYNPDWGSSWVALPADRNTPSGVRPGAGLVFVEGEDENWLFTAQGNYDGGLSTNFWRYPLPMPNKIDFTNSIIYAQNGTNWLNLSDPLPEDFNFRVDANSRFFGGSGWTPTNMGTLPTTTADPFLDADRDLYRMSETGATYTIGYHIYTAPVTATTATGIQAMINTGANQVIVQPGIYEEDVYLVNGVELIGTNPDWTVIRPLHNSSANALVRAMGSNGASFSRFTLDGEDSGLDGFAATGNATNLTVQRVRIFDTDSAITLDGPDSDVEVVHVTAANNTNGLVATNCASLDVRNSIFAYSSGVGLSHQACADVHLHTYNLFWANASDFGGDADAGAAELFLDPSFVDPMDHDYRTLNFSPVIDAGNPTDPSPPGAGSRADIGYIEQGRVNFYVDDSYCAICTNDGLTWQVDAFDNIQDALNAAENALANLNPGIADVPQLVVGVAPGTYNEQVSIPSHVLLFGSGAEETIIDAGGSGTAVSFPGVTDAGIRNFAITNADIGVWVGGASNFIDVRRNLLTNNTTGLSVNGRASASAEYNTFVNNDTSLLTSDGGSWILALHNIIANGTTGAQASNSGQIFSNNNLYFNSTNFDGVSAGDEDMMGQNPQFAGGSTPYRLSQTSPAVDAAALNAPVPNGGGTVADLGYSELLAAPVTLLLGQEDLSTVMGNSGVASVEYGVVLVPDVTSAVTATLPSEWISITLDTPGDTFSYWAQDHTPTEEGFYRFFSRATDMVGNQELDELDWYDGSFVVDSTPPTVQWLSPANGASLQVPLELRAQVTDYAAGQFSVDENDVYFEIDGQRYPATWAAEPWDESANEPRIFRAWISTTLGTYSSVIAGAEDKAGNGATDNGMSFTLTAVSTPDTTPPTVTLTLPAPDSWVTHTVTFSGTATDLGSGIASVEVSLDGGATWRPATVSGEDWSLIWNGPEGLPLVSYPAQVRATDRAGQTAVLPFQFTIDEIAPTGLVPVTFSHPEGSHLDAVTDLEINWAPPIDVSGIITTFLTVDQISDTVPTEVVNGLTAVHSLDSSGDWYAHLAAMDAAGNIQLLHFGPWHMGLNEGYAFAARQQSIIVDGYVDVDNNEWRLDSEYLDDDERTIGSEVTYSPGGQQAFLTAWDADNYFMAWRGGQWTLDGELWIYLKAGGSGSNELIVPLASAPDATLPFAADYAIQITDPLSGTLYQYSGGWQVSAEEWEFANGGMGDTEIRLPLFGTSNVELLAFGLGDDANIWAIFPATNPLNPGSAPAARPAGLDGVTDNGGWQSYQWDDVTAVTNVAENQPLAIGLELELTSRQAPNNPWGPGSTLEYIITINNLEDEVISGQPLALAASLANVLVHDDIVGATCASTDPWSCTLDPLNPGLNVITLTTHLASDLSGLNAVTLVATLTDSNIPPEMQTQDTVIHQIDGEPPTVAVYTAPFVGLGSYSFTGSASDGDGAGVAYVEVRPQFGSWQRADGTELWTVDLTVSPFAEHGDSWQFEVRAVDLYGQISEVETAVFTVDLQGPAVSFDSPTELSGSLNEIMGSINDVPAGSAAETVLVQLDDEPWREAAIFALDETSGSQPFLWTWNMPTEDGVAHTLRVQATDLVGNEGSLSPEQTVWVDNVAPAITVTEVLTEVAVQHYFPGAPIGGPVLAGTATDGTEVDSVAVWLELPNGTSRVDTAVFNPDTDSWQYVPALQTLGFYKLQVRTWDSLGNQNQTELFTLEVKAAPESGPNSFFTPEDTPLTFEPLLDDIDIDSDTITLDAVANPANGSATISSDTQIIYTPTLNFNGTEVFTYTATDGQFFDTATVTVTVLPVNDPPQISGAATLTDTMDEDGTPLVFNLSGVNVDDDMFSWEIIGGTGTAEVSSTSGTGNLNAEISYTPDADFNGSDSFAVQVSDGVYNDSVTIEITVNPVDDAPRAADDYLVLVPDAAALPHLMDVLANDDEVDGQMLRLEEVGTPTGGGTAVPIVNQLHYTTNLAEGASETVSYVVSDGVLTDTATLHVSMVAGVASGEPGDTVVASGIGSNSTIDVTLNIPANVVTGDEQVTFVLRPIALTEEPPQGFKFAGLAFALDVYVDGVLVTSPYALANPITLTIEYSDADVADIGKGDDELMLTFWSGSEWLTDGITLVELDTANNQMVVQIGHLTDFALFGKDMMVVYLPMVVKP